MKEWHIRRAFRIYCIVMLKIKIPNVYKVKDGQTLFDVACAFSVAEGKLVEINSLTQELYVGQLLKIPVQRGHAYVVQEGDTPVLLCGSEERFREMNGVGGFYIGMRVII